MLTNWDSPSSLVTAQHKQTHMINLEVVFYTMLGLAVVSAGLMLACILAGRRELHDDAQTDGITGGEAQGRPVLPLLPDSLHDNQSPMQHRILAPAKRPCSCGCGPRRSKQVDTPGLAQRNAAQSWLLSKAFDASVKVNTVTVDGSMFMTSIRLNDRAKDTILLYDEEAPSLQVLTEAITDYQEHD